MNWFSATGSTIGLDLAVTSNCLLSGFGIWCNVSAASRLWSWESFQQMVAVLADTATRRLHCMFWYSGRAGHSNTRLVLRRLHAQRLLAME
jgi:hypothetical protein